LTGYKNASRKTTLLILALRVFFCHKRILGEVMMIVANITDVVAIDGHYRPCNRVDEHPLHLLRPFLTPNSPDICVAVEF